MSRGNARMQIFENDGDYGFFLTLMDIVFQRFEIRCWNYCLMPNHTHLLIQTSRPNLSDAMQQLNSAYAQWWNKRKERVGHVFQGRFKSQIVEGGGYLLAVSRYIAQNPTRANLVRRPEDWRWSSYSATIGVGQAPAFLSVSPTLELFAPGDLRELQARFKAFVCNGTDVAAEQWIRSNERIIGDSHVQGTVPEQHLQSSDKADLESVGTEPNPFLTVPRLGPKRRSRQMIRPDDPPVRLPDIIQFACG